MNGFDRPTDDMTAVWWCKHRYETFELETLNRNQRRRDDLGIARVDRIWKGFMKRSLLIEARFMVITGLDGKRKIPLDLFPVVCCQTSTEGLESQFLYAALLFGTGEIVKVA